MNVGGKPKMENAPNGIIVENKMGTMPVHKLLFTMSAPIIISMLVQALYNIVDSIFVAKLGEEALTAVSLAFPIQNLMISVAVGTGVGFNALISRYLGEKNPQKANKIVQHAVLLTFGNVVLFIILGGLFSKLFFMAQTNDAEIVGYGMDYMRVISMLSLGLFFQVTFERFLQATGKAHLSMIVQLVGAGTNIILDPILIFGLFGIPRLEVAGAGIATILGQTAAAVVGLMLCVKRNKEISVSMKNFRVEKHIIASIYRIGFPVIMMQSIGSVMIFGINKIVIGASVSAAAVFGVYFRLQSFIFLPIFGLNNGLVSIVAYNYGARNKERILNTLKFAIITSVSIMVVGTCVFWMFPTELLGIFEPSEEMLDVGVIALRVISTGFPIAGFCIMVSGVFQTMGYSTYSLITSIIRQLIAILPLAYIFLKIWGLDAIWLAFPISEIITLVFTLIFFKKMYINTIKPLGEKE